MSADLTLTVQETGPGSAYELTGDQVAALVAVPDLVRLTPAPGGRWNVRGNQKVGLIRLPTRSGGAIHLRLRPKLGIRDLLFLLSYSSAGPWHPEPVTAATADDLLPALADLLARTARRTLEGGVLHGYQEVAEELPLIRGRIRTTDQLRRTGLPLPISVRYDDHTPDIPENRILLAALNLAAHLPGVPDPTRLALRHLAHRLHGVRHSHPGEPLPTWTQTRLNARYTSALRLAELLLSGHSIRQEGNAPTPADGFLLDLPKVFERFLTVTLGEALAHHGIRCAPQDVHRLDEARRATFRPDLVLYRGGRPISVMDAKYTFLKGTSPPVEHLYQLLAYCTALGISHGHLVYAATGRSTAPTDHVIRCSPVTITAHALNLNEPSADLLAQIAALAGRTAAAAPA
ncbi:McrC family protein [Streptomyces poriferorum]|uniref:Restriction endonuclease n=1 Tax=Streptomyces poriferorum TaxID=2798799 RepID=A0ABY9IGQ6_9ACTN|nr:MULTISPECIES: restriction endonuclease [unclassified Streptomyces]MDP5315684.1 restriction endonuclease [Streptomyces sp. Alt4]WLQ54049.1 restriction endonuclease [Streptomyces sp. Alt2]